MATDLTVFSTDRSGTAVSTSASSADATGNTFTNTGNEMARFRNASGSSITITMPIAQTVDGASVSSKTYALAAGADVILGPFNPVVYNNSSSKMTFTYSAVTSLTVLIFKAGAGSA